MLQENQRLQTAPIKSSYPTIPLFLSSIFLSLVYYVHSYKHLSFFPFISRYTYAYSRCCHLLYLVKLVDMSKWTSFFYTLANLSHDACVASSHASDVHPDASLWLPWSVTRSINRYNPSFTTFKKGRSNVATSLLRPRWPSQDRIDSYSFGTGLWNQRKKKRST